MFASILCPVDFSESSIHALDLAFALARRESGRVTLVHVAHPLLVEAAAAAYDLTFVKDDAERELKELSSAAAARGAVPRHDILVNVGDPASEILKIGHGSPPEDHVVAVAETRLSRHRRDLLRHGKTFTGQGSFGGLQRRRLNHSSVGRNRVPFFHDDDVADHKIGGGDAPQLAAANQIACAAAIWRKAATAFSARDSWT